MTDSSVRPHPFWPQGLPAQLTVPQTSLWFNLGVAATRHPHKPAYIYCGGTTTYGRMRDEAEALAGWLQQRCGVGRGDRVLVMGQTSPQFATAVHAVFRADAVLVPVNPMYLADEVAHCARDSGARAIIVAQELFERAAPLLGKELAHAIVFAYASAIDPAEAADAPDWVRAAPAAVSSPFASAWADVIAARLPPRPHEAGADDHAVIAYTSGTTGKPKGVLHTHRSMAVTAMSAPIWRGDRPDTVVLGIAPMAHMMGLQAQVNTACYMGQTVVLQARWDPRTAVRLVRRYRVNHWGSSPAMLLDLMALPELDIADLASLGTIAGGGAPLPAAVNERLATQLKVRYLEGWGMTETASGTFFNPPLRTKPQCLGIPCFGVQARVMDPESGQPVPAGEVGELWVSGGQVMRGYWNRPDATAETIVEVDGQRFLRTGDLVRCDDEGYFFMVDRLKRMINVSGFKVWPAEVEALLHAHPAVQEACVIARQDSRHGESVVAAVVPRARHALGEAELIEWARGQMAAYKCPRAIVFMERLPRSATAKIDWRRVQEDLNRS